MTTPICKLGHRLSAKLVWVCWVIIAKVDKSNESPKQAARLSIFWVVSGNCFNLSIKKSTTSSVRTSCWTLVMSQSQWPASLSKEIQCWSYSSSKNWIVKNGFPPVFWYISWDSGVAISAPHNNVSATNWLTSDSANGPRGNVSRTLPCSCSPCNVSMRGWAGNTSFSR